MLAVTLTLTAAPQVAAEETALPATPGESEPAVVTLQEEDLAADPTESGPAATDLLPTAADTTSDQAATDQAATDQAATQATTADADPSASTQPGRSFSTTPVIGAPNPLAGAQGFTRLIEHDAVLRGGGTAGAVAAGGDLTFGEYSLATGPSSTVVDGTPVAPGLFEQTFAGVFDDHRARSELLAALPATLQPIDSDGAVVTSFDGAEITVVPTGGVNVLTLTAAELAAVKSISVKPAPSPTAPVIINVLGVQAEVGDGTSGVPTLTVDPGAEQGLLWNFTVPAP